MVDIEGALRGSLRGGLSEAGLAPLRSKLYPQPVGLVPRTALLDQVSARRGDVIIVTAPAGYGKSTFIAELAVDDPRPTAWVSLTTAENDPAALLTCVARALDAIEPVDRRLVTALSGRSPTIGSPASEGFGAMLAARRRPFVLVLDDVHELTGRAVLDTLPVVVAQMPAGASIVLAGRTAAPLPLGRLRVKRRVVEIGPAELAFDGREAALLLHELGIDADDGTIARLVDRTEGWPVALQLAALARGNDQGAMGDLCDELTGDHRYLVEYLGEELLGRLDPDTASFLVDAACFERMSGSLCDDVLERRGSAQLLEDLRRRNLLIIPLDDRREWYRFHHLLAEMLASELARHDPRRRAAIQRRACEWCDAHGDGDGAVTYAVRAGDFDLAESMAVRWYASAGTTSPMYPSTSRWVELVPEAELTGRPMLMAAAALACFAGGEPGRAADHLARAAASLPEQHPDDVHGLVGPVMVALARSLIAPLPPDQMATEAVYVYDHVGRAAGHPLACLSRGAAAFMVGDVHEAARRLREGADTTLDRPLVVANCLAHLAVIDAEHGRWPEATAAARRARRMIGSAVAVATTALVLAVTVLVETHAGNAEQVEPDRLLCRQHLTGLVRIAPWLNLQTRVALARAARHGGNTVEAMALVDEADAILATTPGAVHVADQLAVLRREITTHDRSQSFGPSSLTTAELRVLQLLPTHLSVGEIADRLYVSRNTVKSQTIAIYRKLGTSSRGGAVALAAAAGLLEGGPHER